MRYLLKVGNLYLTRDGLLTDRQSDAIKVYSPTPVTIRQVKLRPHGSASSQADPSDSFVPALGEDW
jgi:hypothetical protein